jgi:hypothetical protein
MVAPINKKEKIKEVSDTIMTMRVDNDSMKKATMQ